VDAGREPGRLALVTGLTGQDGSFIAELLLQKGYEVVGLIRGDQADPLGASEHLRDRVQLLKGELLEPESLRSAVAKTMPDELYHLAAPSFAPDTWRNPAHTIAAIAEASATLLEAVRDSSRQTRVFVAVSGQMFGAALESPQNEKTPCRPLSPYGTAKLAAHQLVSQFRAHEGLFACSGILYNHESERRPPGFVSRKITRAAAAIKLGLEHEVVLGDMDAVRDWSFAGDIMEAAWLMLQQDTADDYVLASGVGHTVAELAELAFSQVGLDAPEYVRVDPRLQRPPDLAPLVGDPTRARERLGWKPSLGFNELIARMVDADLRELETAKYA
jgi:GDPmannose 4,6-dehydratase